MAVSGAEWEKVAEHHGLSAETLLARIKKLNTTGREHFTLYRDREGDPLTLGEWAHLIVSPYTLVQQTNVRPDRWVCTIWKGMIDPFERADFEASVFEFRGEQPPRCLETVRYATEVEAVADHDRLVREWSAKEG